MRRGAAGIVPAVLDLYFERGDVLDKISGYQAALENFRMMERLAAAVGDNGQRLRARAEVGSRLTQLGRIDEALALHRAIAAEPKDAQAAEAAFRNCLHLSIALRMLGRYDEALAENDTFIASAAEGSDRYFNGLNSRGQTLWRMGRCEEAADCYRAILEQVTGGSRPVREAMAHNNLGLVFADSGRLDEAREQHEQALRLRIALHDATAVCTSYLNLGNVLVEQGDYAGGMALWDRARGISRKLGDAVTEAMIENNKADLLYRNGEFREAAAHFQKSLEMKESLNLRSYFASSLQGLVKTHYELRADPECRERCRQYAERLAALDAAQPRQQAYAREILIALGSETAAPP